mmetsp:Transcript_23611/g.20974  ORF Transcript_23611/g.20974 Transcript_23611/m.20974 type:complete len:96 (+) Transcript_23611:19-306(+)|eukprot:CAMPEP_0205803868 /NCGR_PEP_ID=MMETSP0205-20121125/6616_1 /ASSEMBLY_ACC=CAM_ASM_000278 /TAXON_ID=36767 /ORGANISM="Euplotes focardii, Strain TN1" /LENGTH=95 /DNA_ID=CAMNT_0053072565 /DNA_START=113 /DNA_END=400 /DNA_ORIENTATION=+
MWGRKKKTKTEPKKVAKVSSTKAKKPSTKAKFNKPESKEESKEKLKHNVETIYKVYATGEEFGKPLIDSEGIQLLAEDWNLDLASSAELIVFMFH